MNIKRNGSQASGKGNTDWFTGTVRIDQPFQAEELSFRSQDRPPHLAKQKSVHALG
jgi:hypothetical protein